MRAIADALRAVGGAIATVVSLPFRLVAKLFGGASRGTRGGGRARRA
ncbi:LPFR motif small protein [Streptomyces sp. NPDC051217]